MVDAIHNLRFRKRRKRFVGPRKHGGEEDGSLLYTPLRKFSSTQSLREQEVGVKMVTEHVNNEM